MDIFEKQQRIESINGIIKVRWFIIAIILGLGFILKAKYFGQWGTGFGENFALAYLKMGILGLMAFSYNFFFWLFMRRLGRKPLEKISERALSIMSILQIVPDQLICTLVYYNTGTVDSMSFVYYFISVFLASSIYKTRGIILTGLLSGFLCTTLLIIEYQGLIPHFNTYQGVTLFGSPYVTRGKIITFIFYISVMTFAAAFLSNLIRSREKKLRQERDKVTEQSQVLTVQTQELTKTKDYLHEALTKSDAARVEIEKTKTELEKANLELQAKLRELEKYGQVTTGRELKMMELKEKIKTLEKRIEELEKK
ncbi:MAG: hypothetical protein CO001_01055 [Candidatus Portnoybacteria bacterium CG_4_8_14_3_um_filter_40_10]|uniref:Uncharacterized protein n=4 Tax=Candidatus Portnoyibacteriota TaxID=1817913 RepID=A0A2M7IJ14_9BACT|nr:MAG: hypothetical protein COT41_00130 [Candidatus Portnoybacteria bacterium CG08_land_8_20_14_0_20_40_83]PIW76492.1 MAG: hypothetical protein CO001_01055 [Candidatus Portnoybacteria bacterium CG_4_8_14_3_um_filter_40_10]PIY74300.1 MAG: hypothetical protein COY85_03655 [Candidatus Portnoybacteria bacterium CG_4_10_14_0_8_um_filter_40_50]